MTPNSIVVKIDGEDVRVATSKDENAILNQILASQMRHLIQKMIKSYKDKDATLNPKELADLSRAARDVAQMSSDVYLMSEIDAKKQSPQVAQPEASSVDFSKIGAINVTSSTNDVRRDEEKTGTDGERPDGNEPGQEDRKP